MEYQAFVLLDTCSSIYNRTMCSVSHLKIQKVPSKPEQTCAGQGVTVYRSKVNGNSGEIGVKVKRVAGATASGWHPALRHSSRGSGHLRGSCNRRALVRLRTHAAGIDGGTGHCGNSVWRHPAISDSGPATQSVTDSALSTHGQVRLAGGVEWGGIEKPQECQYLQSQ